MMKWLRKSSAEEVRPEIMRDTTPTKYEKTTESARTVWSKPRWNQYGKKEKTFLCQWNKLMNCHPRVPDGKQLKEAKMRCKGTEGPAKGTDSPFDRRQCLILARQIPLQLDLLGFARAISKNMAKIWDPGSHAEALCPSALWPHSPPPGAVHSKNDNNQNSDGLAWANENVSKWIQKLTVWYLFTNVRRSRCREIKIEVGSLLSEEKKEK